MNTRTLLIAAAALLASQAAAASDVTATITDTQGKPLTDAVVYIMPVAPARAPAAKPAHAVIDQVDKVFVPKVSVVRTGTAVDFPNSDNIRHQVYSFSSPKTFTLKLYSGRPSEPVVFDKPGVIVLGCNIHDDMVAFVLAVDTPWFARSERGSARIASVPAGHYDVFAWSAGTAAPVAAGRIELDGSAPKSLTLKLAPAATAALDGGGRPPQS